MAVQPQTPYKEYTANGSTKSFALEFDCDNQDHLIVLVDDVEAIVGTWSLSNGAVVFGNAPATGKKITVQRNTPFRRDGDFQSYDNSFRPGPVNKGLDWIWLKLQELGVADWILSNRIDALKSYVDQQDNILQDNIDSLKNYVDDKDDELRNYLLNAIQEQGVALDQLEEYYSYLMQQLAQVAIDRGWAASFIVSADGSTQQEINDFGGARWWNKPLGYKLGATVKLTNGDIVKSTVDGNTNDPNVNMTNWDQPYSVYNFKTEQPLQWYFNKYGNWDDAIFQAQCNVHLKGFSSKLIFPKGTINITKPILGGKALGDKMVAYFNENNIPNSMLNSNNQYNNSCFDTHFVGAGRNDTSVNFIRPTAIDKTYASWGAFHIGCTAQDHFNAFANSTNLDNKGWWKMSVVLDKFSLSGQVLELGSGVPDKAANYKPFAHGVVILGYGANGFSPKELKISNFWGAGLLCDHVFDSTIKEVLILGCGRMVGDYPSYAATNNYRTLNYQLYAPLQFCKMIGGSDNTNFIRLTDFHLEDNDSSVVDVLTSSSVPIWFNDWHVECEKGSDNTKMSFYENKCAVYNGGGICCAYFGQDMQSGFDINNFQKLGNNGSINLMNGFYLYPESYKDAYIGAQYSYLRASACDLSGRVLLNAGNTASYISIYQSITGKIEAGASSATKALTLDDVKVFGDIFMSFNCQFSFKDVVATGKLSVQNTPAYTLPNFIKSSLFSHIEGHLYSCFGSASTTSTTNSNNYMLTNGDFNLISDAFRLQNAGY